MKRPFEVSPELFPFKSRWCDVEGVPIHYIDEGNGPVLLLLHGNFMWSFSFRNLIAALSPNFRCIAIDLAGMGMSGKSHLLGKSDDCYTLRSQSQYVEYVLDSLAISELTLLAYDHGGPIGFGLATRRPELIKRILVCNSWAWSNEAYTATRLWSQIAPRFGRLIRHVLLNKPKRWIFEPSSELKKPGVWEACVAPYQTLADLKPILSLASQLTNAKDYFANIENNLKQLDHTPIELVWATRGGGLFPEFVDEDVFLKRWQTMFPKAKTNIMCDAPYYFMAKPPDTFLQVIQRFAKA